MYFLTFLRHGIIIKSSLFNCLNVQWQAVESKRIVAVYYRAFGLQQLYFMSTFFKCKRKFIRLRCCQKANK
jgi:hypothetical protein